jgi:hypothetical protein
MQAVCEGLWAISGYKIKMIKTQFFQLLGFFALLGCRQPVDQATSSPPAYLAALANQVAGGLVSVQGSWHPTGNIFYSGTLTIRDNGTFQFFDEGCMGKAFSEGTWKLYGQGLILTSSEEFRDTSRDREENLVNTMVEDTTEPEAVDWTKKDTAGVMIHLRDTSFIFRPAVLNFNDYKTTFTFSRPDTARVYFDKEVYVLKGDTLISMDAMGREGTKFIKH